MSLLERRLIARIQRRVGPSNCGIAGVFQPVADAIKLLFKYDPLDGSSAQSIIGVCILFTVSLCQLTIIPLPDITTGYEHGLLLVILTQSLIAFSEVLIGTRSGSKYGIIGGNRAYIQNLGGHLSLLMMIIAIMLITKRNSLSAIPFSWRYIPLAIMFFITILITANRTPFDFTEAESELVGGAYVEYGGVLFGLVHLADYLNLVFISALYSTLFTGNVFVSACYLIGLFLKAMFVSSIIILLRAILARYKQDKMIRTVWQIIIPLSAILTCAN